ncbi:doublecortin domain-containing protein 2 [Astyanax mexicanus]|uniref:Doublecortin domain containing 2 n=1 Tax=Astyanax mexicanus TaxID=7994 RepID=A0A8B9KYF4_ASTMX|nr:doublecortin domain-containing protein 2 [Astyanax mexicanus]
MPGVRSSLQAQPAVKSILVYRNGEHGRGPRRVVLHEKRVSSLEGLLRELSGGTRRLHTPQGHRVGALQDIQHRGAYVAAGTETFKKIDYLQIGNRNKQTTQSNGVLKPVPQNRINVSARFLKPINEPCTIFIVANGDVLNPAVRLLVHSRLLGQFERILEMVTEKMGLRVLGGVRSLYTFDGISVMDGKELENGQFYVAVGRDKFKRLPYADLLFTKPMGLRRVYRSKAASLPPIDGFRRQNGDLGNRLSKSTVGCGDSREEKTKDSVPSLVREFSQARLATLRKKRSGLMMSLSTEENDDGEQADGEDEESGEKDSGEEPSAAEQETEAAECEEGEDEGPGSDDAAQAAEEKAPPVKKENENEEEENTGGDGEGEETAQNEEQVTEGAEEGQAEEEAGEAEEDAVQAEEEAGQAEEEAGQAEEEAGQAEEEAGQAEEEAGQADEEAGAADEAAANEEG